MKSLKRLLLGTVAGLAATAGAQAADLPVARAAPVEYVRVCSTYGAGFFFIPGTETCLRIGGRVRADYIYNEPFTRGVDALTFRARGRIQADARTQTAYGLLRTFVRFEITKDTGAASSANVAQAFIQFGGLTAGRVTSFFSNADLPTGHMGTLRFYDAPDVNLLAYTFSFGNGFSATLALEDSSEARASGGATGLFDPDGAGPATPILVTTAFPFGGQRAPDLVGNVKYTATWGSAQLSGVVHQLRTGNVFNPDTEYGFAVSAQVGVNLPMLGASDAAWIAATYANGAVGYLSGGGPVTGATAGTLTGALQDAYVNAFTGEIERGEGWSIAGGIRHYWTPQIRQNVFGSYLSVDYGGAAAAFAVGGSAVTPIATLAIPDFQEWRIGTNVIWQPVAGLDIGVEVLYANIDFRGPTPFNAENDSWSGRIRVQRDF